MPADREEMNDAAPATMPITTTAEMARKARTGRRCGRRRSPFPYARSPRRPACGRWPRTRQALQATAPPGRAPSPGTRRTDCSDCHAPGVSRNRSNAPCSCSQLWSGPSGRPCPSLPSLEPPAPTAKAVRMRQMYAAHTPRAGLPLPASSKVRCAGVPAGTTREGFMDLLLLAV